jgi:superfamily I DNA/RNA helicase/RecB family exonuclease
VPTPAAPPALDASQQAVVEHRDGPLLVLAGPGTGKTATLVEAMVARLVGPDALEPGQVLGLTFGRRAAEEWRDRVLTRIGGGVAPTISTFHALAWSLVRTHHEHLAFDQAPRLLSGAEEDARVRELLSGAIADQTLPWPPDLAAALACPSGLADELRAVLMRARLLGMTPEMLAEAADRAGDDGWRAAAVFMQEYEEILGRAAETDYSSLISDAIALMNNPQVAQAWRGRFKAVFIDEYQDTDPAQADLIRALVGPEATLIAVGDPDQSIYAFRGAHLSNIERFNEVFGGTHPPIVLASGRRFGPVIRAAATGIVSSIGYRSLNEHIPSLRAVDCSTSATAGIVDVLHFQSAGAQAASIADLIRRTGMTGGLTWDDVAVLVRSRTAIPAIQRALTMAGVPVDVAADDLPLARDPAVAPLLLALRVVARPEDLTPEVASVLLRSPLGQADPADLRRLSRVLRQAERRLNPLAPQTPSASILRDAVREPAMLTAVPDGPARHGARAVERLAHLLTHARSVAAAGAGVPEVLWALWHGPDRQPSPWPEQLRMAALAGGHAGRRADRDLDAICLLFDLAHEGSRRGPRQGIIPFLRALDEQQVAATSRDAARSDTPAVRLMTAHRAKGLQWPLVIVAGVQEGQWPDLRRRGSVLQPDRLGRDGQILEPIPASALLDEERRLFYVACTRAQHHLVVTAVDGGVDGEQPSRLLPMLGVEPVAVSGRPARPLAVAPLVAALRTALESPDSSDAVRAAAARRLADLAPRISSADPRSWWGVSDATSAAAPVREALEPIRLSGSALATLDACPRRWFLEREARAQGTSSVAQSFGNVVHAVAEHITLGTLAEDVDVIEKALDVVWPRMGYDAPWYSRLQRQEASAAVLRFLHWHREQLNKGHQVIGVEKPFTATLSLPADDGSVQNVTLQGFIDRVEVIPQVDGSADIPHVIVYDLKTEASPPTADEVARHPQLAFYQLAVREDAIEGIEAAVSDGAALVQLRKAKGAGPKVQQQGPLQQEPVTDVDPSGRQELTWVEHMLADAALTVRSERFHAVVSPKMCRTCDFASSCPARSEGREIIR